MLNIFIECVLATKKNYNLFLMFLFLFFFFSKFFFHHVKLLEQEKYALRKKLNSIEIEYENKLHDLHSDLETANENLRTHVDISKQSELETNRMIAELSEQNRRLTTELKEVCLL